MMQELPNGDIRDTAAWLMPADRFIKSSVDTTTEQLSNPLTQKSFTPSFFNGHLLRTSENRPVSYNKYQPDWILFVLLLWGILIAWVRFFYRKRFQQLILAPFSRRFQNQLLREGTLFSERLSVALGLTYFLSFALLIYEVNLFLLKDKTPPYLNGFSLYLVILLLVLVYWFIKVMMMIVLGSVFKTKNTTHDYLINVLIINILTSLTMFPPLVLSIYLKSHILLNISMIILAVFFLFRFVKGFLTGLSLTKFSYIFLFVYLCALEILPLILTVKFSLLYYHSMMLLN
jgi:hypothetical protein